MAEGSVSSAGGAGPGTAFAASTILVVPDPAFGHPSRRHFMRTGTLEQDVPRTDSDVVELSLLVPRWQLDQLQTLAEAQGLTLGQVLRRLINAFLREP
jgi:hypothetical protein